MASGAPVILAGDYDVVPTPQDIYPTRSLDNNALDQPESRNAFARLLAQGWTDAMRKLHPDGPLWTFWDYKFERWPKDKGMRLDHFLLSPTLSDRLVGGGGRSLGAFAGERQRPCASLDIARSLD
jgi:exodeoxyribonuclease-3